MLLLLSLFAYVTGQYCPCGPTTTVDTNLGTTTLVGDSKSIADTTDCPGTIGPKDLTTLSADLSSKTYLLTTNVTTCGNSFPTLTGAWIDWNQNTLFEENEVVGPFLSTRGVIQWSFTVPTGALSGKTRLRVQAQETSASVINPCASFPYGATKDFSVEVKGGSNDLMCISGPLTNEDSNLGAVTLIGETRNIRDATDCPGQLGPQNFLDQIVDLIRGRSYNISFNVTTCGDSYNTSSAVWIDYDNDLIFSSADLAVTYTKQQGVINAAFTVPTGSYLGDTVLRVQVQETESLKIDPCATFSYGGTKDFTVTLLPPKYEEKKL